MFKIKLFKAEDVANSGAKELPGLVDYKQALAFFEEQRITFSIYHGDVIVAIIGGALLQPGQVECFTWLSSFIKQKHPLYLTKTTLRIMEYVRRKKGVYRYTMHTEEGAISAWLWAETLGFSFEGVCYSQKAKGVNLMQFSKIYD